MTPASRVLATVLLASTIAGCAADAGVGDAEYSITDSAGIRIIESRESAWGENGRRIEAEPFLRIGNRDESPYQFAFIPNGLLLADGEIAVAEASAGEVRIFDSAGNHLRTFGRTGDGPGEFRSLAGPFAYPGDSLAVYDHALRRITVFPRAADAHRSLANEVEGNFQVFGILRSGQVLLYDPGRGYRPDLQPGLQWDTTEVVATNPSDGTFRIIGRLASRQQWILPDGNIRVYTPAHGSIRAVTDDGFYWATSDRYEIAFHDAEGSLRRIMRRPVQPRSVEPSMIEEYVEANLEWVRRMEGESSVPRYRQRFEEGAQGEHVPLFSLAFVDRDRRLWVSGPAWPSFQGWPRQWSVFSHDGIWLGDLEAPEGARIVDSRGDTVLAIWRDELDVPHVQLHRIAP